MEPRTAVQKLEISKPVTTKSVNQSKKPLMIKVKRPKVKIFIGIVINKRRGFNKTLKTAITTATITAVRKLAMKNPGTKYAVINKTPIFIKNFNKPFSFILIFYHI
jgi:hypothetical protein